MSSPITFDVTAGAIPDGFEGDLQALLNLFASRLIIAPSVPWSAFQLGEAQPSSNQGPWFKDGRELRVWSDDAGTYVPVTIDGSGVVPETLPLSAIVDLPPQQVLISDIDGRASYIGGAPGQVCTVAESGTPVFKNPPSGQLFYASLSTAFPYVPDGTARVVPFDLAFGPESTEFNTSTYKFVIPADGAGWWFFYASLQIDDVNNNNTNTIHNLVVSRNGGLGGQIGNINSAASFITTNGISVSGLLAATAGDTFDVRISTLSAPSAGNEFSVNINSANTRFGGFRLI